MPPPISNITNQRFGRLVATSRIGKTRNNVGLWLCKCDCGADKVVRVDVLKRGISQSCGCLAVELTKSRSTTHGETGPNKTKEYDAWTGFKNRCDNPNNKDYHRYGGRGITYDPRWAVYENFLEDMGRCPNDLTLDRIDNNGNYCKDNCRWSTRQQQMLNRNKWQWQKQ